MSGVPGRARTAAELASPRGGLRLLRGFGPLRASDLGDAVAGLVRLRLPVSRVADANLRAGMNPGTQMDQKMNDGAAARFFERGAMTLPALALRFRCTVIPAHVQQRGPAWFRPVVEPWLALTDSGDRPADVLALTAAANDAREQWITKRPEGWLWLRRRWPKAAEGKERPLFL